MSQERERYFVLLYQPEESFRPPTAEDVFAAHLAVHKIAVIDGHRGLRMQVPDQVAAEIEVVEQVALEVVRLQERGGALRVDSALDAEADLEVPAVTAVVAPRGNVPDHRSQ